MSQSAAIPQRLLNAMAYNREQFKDKVEEKVGGALLEFYKAELAEVEGQTRWVQHWRSEVQRLIQTELVVAMLHSIKGFKDRRKAAVEVLAHLRSIDGQYRRAAQNTIQRDYGLKRIRSTLSDETTESLFAEVLEVVEAHA